MKKISYRVNFGLVGSKKSGIDSGKEIFINYLKSRTIENKLSKINVLDEDFLEYFIVFKLVPIKVRVFLAENLNQLITWHKKIKNLDIIVLAINIYDLDSLNVFNKNNYNEFCENFHFKGLSTLVGIDVNQIYGIPISTKSIRISKENLIKKAKELNVLYCYKIKYKHRDISEFYEKIFKDLIFEFQMIGQEFFEQAKLYGKELIEQFKFLKLNEE
ncbi:MAG: hypothetical protein ACFFAH_17805 [Promethearchaeota archaeon]